LLQKFIRSSHDSNGSTSGSGNILTIFKY
jgi:hypothetical protein